jgi:hypothetical protein
MLRKAGRSDEAVKASERAAALGLPFEVEAARKR